MEQPKDIIYLQWFADNDIEDMPETERAYEVTWCEDKILNNDIAYMRVDLHEAEMQDLEQENATLRKEVERLKQAILDAYMMKNLGGK